MPMDNCPSSIWVDQLVVIGAAHVDESGLLQSFYEFPCCHELFIYIMRIKKQQKYTHYAHIFLRIIAFRRHFSRHSTAYWRKTDGSGNSSSSGESLSRIAGGQL